MRKKKKKGLKRTESEKRKQKEKEATGRRRRDFSRNKGRLLGRPYKWQLVGRPSVTKGIQTITTRFAHVICCCVVAAMPRSSK